MSPDVFIGQEFKSQAAIDSFLTTILNGAPTSPGDWAAAPFVATPGNGTGNAGESAFFYRTSKASYLGTTIASAGGVSNPNGQPRNTYRYDFQIGTQKIGAYSVHMKSGSASSDQDRRQVEANNIRLNAQGTDTNGTGSGLPAGYQFLVAGDFNIQASTQTAYQTLVQSSYSGSNLGQFIDPIKTPGTWNNNSAFKYVHTQDPAGQMDDRLDMMLLSGGLVDGAGLDYVGKPSIAYSTTTWNDPNHSYRSWGNDGSQALNAGITVTGNQMVGQAIAQALVNTASGGGHLPVFLDLAFVSVPEPGTLVFVLPGLLLVPLIRRRRSNLCSL